MKLTTRIVEKPWGRSDLPLAFGEHGGRRIGEIWFERADGEPLPLLAKFLFTSERLSIQVHPDDASARATGMANGKDECWLVLDAEPDAHIGVGPTRPLDRAELRAAALDGSIEALMDWRPARAGDFIYNPAGTIHAIGPGLCVLEVQQPSECTYRLYDYGRPRELHLDEAVAVASLGPAHDPRDRHVGQERGGLTLVDGPKFGLHHVRGQELPADLPEGPLLILPLGPGCAIDGVDLPMGEAAYVDAACIAIGPEARMLIAWPT
ncbi:MAG: class I mannose-6-phosphate isomerase [Sphingopyxis sp.]|nr:class I mannose-6-phosphate isomerase [Sphingopyxis sp.]